MHPILVALSAVVVLATSFQCGVHAKPRLSPAATTILQQLILQELNEGVQSVHDAGEYVIIILYILLV